MLRCFYNLMKLFFDFLLFFSIFHVISKNWITCQLPRVKASFIVTVIIHTATHWGSIFLSVPRLIPNRLQSRILPRSMMPMLMRNSQMILSLVLKIRGCICICIIIPCYFSYTIQYIKSACFALRCNCINQFLLSSFIKLSTELLFKRNLIISQFKLSKLVSNFKWFN